ncbi:hypothetical protein CBR_g74639 [Chara braunii]|uniref:Uncharacterized protein n=1 Tax=Chara braunii TaxID=69332 RepID=A0A388KA60_CHABU|nr:hypothetical protein CBR_g74639 [Chara braunii]|eukprot:GBG66952.1 hypothetical protein CBR_g74639 [Chara braunii]
MALVRTSSSCMIGGLASEGLHGGCSLGVGAGGSSVGCWGTNHVLTRWERRGPAAACDESLIHIGRAGNVRCGKKAGKSGSARAAETIGSFTSRRHLGHVSSLRATAGAGASCSACSSSSVAAFDKRGTRVGGGGGEGITAAKNHAGDVFTPKGGNNRGLRKAGRSNRYCRCEAGRDGGSGDADHGEGDAGKSSGSGTTKDGGREGGNLPAGFSSTSREREESSSPESGWEVPSSTVAKKGGGGVGGEGGEVVAGGGPPPLDGVSKMREGIWDMMSVTSKRLQQQMDALRGKTASVVEGGGCAGNEEEEEGQSEWERWQSVFGEVEERDTLVKALKMQMQLAVEREDYSEAAKLKEAIKGCQENNAVDDIMEGLKRALAEERYSDAAKLRDEGFAGLVGWWAGIAEGTNDPYGRIIKISPSQGRFVGRSYTPRQLAAAAEGTPVLEIYVTKDGGNLRSQAVYLQRESGISVEQIGGEAMAEFDDGAEIGFELDRVEEDEESGGDIEGISREEMDGEDEESKGKSPVKWDADTKKELSRILNYLKKRLPDIKVKMFHVVNPGGSDSDLPKIIEKLMGNGNGADDEGGPDMADIASKLEELETENEGGLIDGKHEEDTGEEEGFLRETEEADEKKGSPIRLVVGALHSTGNDSMRSAPQRVEAKIEKLGRDSFAFRLVNDATSSSGSESSMWTSGPEGWKVAALAAQASADIMPDDVARVMFNMDKAAVKVSKEQVAREIGDMFKLALAGSRRKGLAKSTLFQRMNVADANRDPLSGIYIGAFGPHGPEVVQLRRCYGRWPEEPFHNWAVLRGVSDSGPPADESDGPYEYVEAVKLTGDLNVPAGQVTFRARIGKDKRLPHRGIYPEELGVVARYKGQGRLAEPGFKNPRWVDGELVQLNGKGGPVTSDAELGFVFSVPGERHILVLFNRLKLEE